MAKHSKAEVFDPPQTWYQVNPNMYEYARDSMHWICEGWATQYEEPIRKLSGVIRVTPAYIYSCGNSYGFELSWHRKRELVFPTYAEALACWQARLLETLRRFQAAAFNVDRTLRELEASKPR